MTIEPARLRIAGARSEVLRLSEVLTETIDVAGASATIERTVRVAPGGLHVWLEGPDRVTVQIPIVPLPEPPPAAPAPAPRRGRR